MSSLNQHRLPPETGELLEYLHPKDLATGSMVNRRWHSIYAGFKVHRLVAIGYGYYEFSKWYDSNQAIREGCPLRDLPSFACRALVRPNGK